MAYIDHRTGKNQRAAVMTVVAILQGAAIVALINGLAVTWRTQPPIPNPKSTDVPITMPIPVPPPPHDMPVEQKTRIDNPQPKLPPMGDDLRYVLPPIPLPPDPVPTQAYDPPLPPKLPLIQHRAPKPKNAPGGWATPNDYPAPDLPEGNRLGSGRWFSAADLAGKGGDAAASVEDGLARTLGLAVGDRMEFAVAGEKIAMTVVGLRKVNWDTMRANFFVLTPPAVLQGYPASWITSFYLPPEKAEFVNRLVGEFPNLTVIDVAAILRQLQSIMDQVARAVQFIFLFTLAAGVIVLHAALASAAEERRYELAVMRALGARREQLRRALLAEFAAIGGLAGLIAALAAMGVGQFLARQVFRFEVAIDPWLPLAATCCGAILVTAAGWFAAARLLHSAPLEALRAGSA